MPSLSRFFVTDGSVLLDGSASASLDSFGRQILASRGGATSLSGRQKKSLTALAVHHDICRRVETSGSVATVQQRGLVGSEQELEAVGVGHDAFLLNTGRWRKCLPLLP